ncbi:MAG: serine hydrolase [Planctomycetota bacterium]
MSNAVATTALLLLSSLLPAPAPARQEDPLSSLGQVDWEGWADLDGLLSDVRRTTGVPALSAAFLRDGKVVAAATSGVSEAGGEDALDASARFHLGSVTKSFTGVLIGRLVEEGALAFDTTVGDLLDHLEPRAEYRDVTVEDLLRHEGGLHAYTVERPAGASASGFEVGTPTECREAFLVDALGLEPAVPRGTPLYSNAGFALLGHMAEVATGTPWEILIQREVLGPLGLAHTAVGFPERPRGHVFREGRFLPVPLDAYPTMTHLAPAGHLHSTVGDLMTYARFHLDGLAGADGLLSAATVARLHGRDGGGRALAGGWRMRTFAGEREHWHGGTVGASWAELRLRPDSREASAVLVAVEPSLGEVVANRLQRALRERYGEEAKNERGGWQAGGGLSVTEGTADSVAERACWEVVERLARAINAEDRAAYHALFAAGGNRADRDSMFDFMARNVMPSRGAIHGFHELPPPLVLEGQERPMHLVTFHLERGFPGYFGLSLDDAGHIADFSLFVKAELCPNGPDPTCDSITRFLGGDALAGPVPGDSLRAQQILDRAVASESREELWSALTELAAECRERPAAETRAWREQALALLVERPSDTRRWSSLLATAFLPPVTAAEPGVAQELLEEHDRLLRGLLDRAGTDAVRAELLHARVLAHVLTERQLGITDAARRRALAVLDELVRVHGQRTVPGGAEPESLASRAAPLVRELERLARGAFAPDLSGIDLAGDPLDLKDLRGRIVVVDFWTSFCSPCLALVPEGRRLLDTYGDDGVVYLGVCGDETREEGSRTARRTGMTWRNLWDGPRGTAGPASTAWCVEAVGWPSVFVVDRDGRIRERLHGADVIRQRLEPLLRALLEE